MMGKSGIRRGRVGKTIAAYVNSEFGVVLLLGLSSLLKQEELDYSNTLPPRLGTAISAQYAPPSRLLLGMMRLAAFQSNTALSQSKLSVQEEMNGS
jgi:hypothetical protein